MRAVRYLLRIGGLALAGGAVFFGLVLLLNAQVLLNRYAELYMMDTAESSAAAPTNNVSAHVSAGVEPARERRAQLPDPRPAPPVALSEAGATSVGQVPEPQATSPATVAKSEGAAAIYVSNAESIAGLEASDRRVDVVLTGTSAAVSEVVLENVRVLAIELVATKDGIAERPPVHAVTLDVDAETTQNLLLASRAGKLSLALHRGGDNRRMAAVRESASPDVVGTPQVVTTPPVVDTPQQAVTTPPVVDTPQQAVTTTPVAEPSQQGAGTPQAVDIPQTVSQPPVAVQNRDPRFVVVTVHRFGGRSSTYRVPRER